MKVLKTDKLEELLVANWTGFLDTSKLMVYVLGHIQETINKDFAVIIQSVPHKTQITISRFQLIESGFLIWVDFSAPREEGVAVGTAELHISPKGHLTHIRTVGNLFVEA